MPKQSIPDQFSDEEMEQMKRHGAAQLGGTDFSAEVEKELDKLQAAREASAGKMQAAQTGGSEGLGPSDIDTAAIKQRGAIQKQADTQGAAEAQQAQSTQAPINAPAAPTGPQGATIPFPAQKGAVGGPGNAPAPSQTAPPAQPPPEGEGDESDPATQWPQ
jgi:hypothetical protein